MLPTEKLDLILRRHEELGHRLTEGVDASAFSALSRELAELEPVADAIRGCRALEKECADLAHLLADSGTDADMRALAEEELPRLKSQLAEAEAQLRLALLPRDAADEKGAILEIRAGTGGDEAALFAGDLFRMYQKYAERRGWSLELISASEGTMGGFKEIIAQVNGKGVFARLKFERGTHRVQRVPATETQGRIHTSAATVAVLPEVAEVDMRIDDGDLRIDTMRAGGAGGQHVNKTESAIRITHIPSGIVVMMQEERSQHRNKAKAMDVLRSRLYDLERQKLDDARAADRRSQVGSGDRSERIRTYNFPQGRVSDHRINLTLYKIDKVVEGEALDEILDPLIADHQARLLAESEKGRGMRADLMDAFGAWWVWALLAAGFAALTAIFAKLGVEGVDSDLATLVRTIVVVCALSLLLAATGRLQWTAIGGKTMLFLAFSGLATGASWLCYFRALKLGDAARVAPIDKLSVVLVAIFGVIFLGERLSAPNWLGVVLIAIGALLVAFRV